LASWPEVIGAGIVLSVDPGVAFGTRLPAAVHPQPLVRILPNIALDRLGEKRGICDHICFEISRGNEGYAGTEAKDILPSFLLPKQETRKHLRSGLHGNARQTRTRTCQAAEEVDKDTLRRGHIRVHEDADGFSATHRGQEPTRKVVFVQNLVTMQAANAVDKVVYEAIVEPANNYAHGITHERMVETGQLPGAS
jgi:hypothetical protein